MSGLEAAAEAAAASCSVSRERFAQKLRAACLSRVRESRQELLASLRGRGAGEAQGGGAAGAVSQLVRSVVASQLGTVFSTGAQSSPLPPLADGEEGMEEDGMWEAGAALHSRRGGDQEALSSQEQEQLLAELERFLTDSLREEEAALLAAYEESLAAEEAAQQERVLEMQLWEEGGDEEPGAGGSQGEQPVPCPVCRRRRLLAQRGVVLCACGGVRLELGDEGIGLPEVRQRLAEAWEGHAGGGCREEPKFQQAAAPGSGQQHLWLTCATCSCLAVVA